MNRSSLIAPVLTAAVTALTLLGCAPSGSQSADGPPPLFVQLHLQIKPGELQGFEEARQRAIDYRTAEGYPWNEFVTISETNVARITTPLPNGWADMEAQREWFNARPGGGGSGMPDTVSRIRREILEPMPGLFYEPEVPRVTQGQAGWTHEVKVYTRPGTRQRAQESIGAPSAALRAAGSDQPRFVARTVVGGRSSSYSVFYPAVDATDYYGNREALQSIIRGALRDGPGDIVVRTERTNWINRPDLGYSSGN